MTNQNSPVRVLLCDDHHLVREGIRSCLSDYPAVSIVGEAIDGQSALNKVKELRPAVVLMDVNMPGMNGLEATKIITKRFPGIKIIALTVHDNREYVAEILRSGAAGYVLKNTSPEQLVTAIKAVDQGGTYFSASVSHILAQPDGGPVNPEQSSGLTKRELQVLKLIADGNTNKDVATALNIGVRTVETHRARLMRKLNARTAAELARIAAERGLY